MALLSIFLVQSAVAKGEEILPVFLAHLRRLYPEVYGPAVSIGHAPKHREFPLREGKLLSDGTSVISFSTLSAYAAYLIILI